MNTLESESIVVEAPMSFTGSYKRLVQYNDGSAVSHATVAVAIVLAWVAVLCWYALFGICLVPYRLIRRSQRKQQLLAAQHRELLEAQRRTSDERQV